MELLRPRFEARRAERFALPAPVTRLAVACFLLEVEEALRLGLVRLLVSLEESLRLALIMSSVCVVLCFCVWFGR